MTRKYSHSQKHEPVLEILLQLIRYKKIINHIKQNTIIADLGCGYNGNYLKIVSKKIKEGVGIDISVSKKHINHNISLIESDFNNSLPLKNSYFDTVTAMAVIEHIKDAKMFLTEIKRVLKSGGTIFITTPSKKAKSVLEFLSYKLKVISKDEISDHKTYFDKDDLTRLLKTCGFRKIKVTSFEMGYNLFAVATK